MPDADALFWALQATYGGQCVDDRHGLVFAGDGFVVHLGSNGRVAVRAAEGRSAPAQGWLLGALTDFLAPAGARRDAHGVAVLSGRHVVHFRADGTVSVGALPEGGPAPGGHPAGRSSALPHGRSSPAMTAGRGRPARVRSSARPEAPPRSDRGGEDAAAGSGAAAAPLVDDAGAEPGGPRAADDVAQAVADLAARWAGPIPDPPPGAGRALLHEIRSDRKRVNDLLTRLREEQACDSRERRSATLSLVRLDTVLRSAALRLAQRSR